MATLTRRRAGRLTIALAAALCAVLASGSTAGRAGTKGWREPVLITTTQGGVEVSLAINPRDERRLAVCGPSGFPAALHGSSYFHGSADGGATWSPLDVETSVTDTRGAAFEGGDCDVAYDAGGTLWTADTWLGSLSIGHSRDGRAFEGTALATPAAVVDRPWLAGGPPGTVYVTYQDLQCCTPSVVWFTKTTDYGATFAPPMPVTTATAAGAFTWLGNLAAANGGRDLYAVYARRALPFHASTPYTITVAASHDSGATWTSRPVVTVPEDTASMYPSLAVDAGGHLHVVWSARRVNDVPVFHTTSKDRGASWSAPRALSAGEESRVPWVAGGAKGQARVAWLSVKGADPGTYIGYAKIADGRVVARGKTTTRPVWDGDDPWPEFGMVRLDRRGRMHVAMSIYKVELEAPPGEYNPWAFVYQRES